jgi:predicted HicB family RNase H-like nuclease
MKTKKDPRGGARDGAGRKKGIPNKTPGASVSKTIRMTPELAALATRAAEDRGQSFQSFAADAIEAFLKNPTT